MWYSTRKLPFFKAFLPNACRTEAESADRPPVFPRPSAGAAGDQADLRRANDSRNVGEILPSFLLESLSLECLFPFIKVFTLVTRSASQYWQLETLYILKRTRGKICHLQSFLDISFSLLTFLKDSHSFGSRGTKKLHRPSDFPSFLKASLGF